MEEVLKSISTKCDHSNPTQFIFFQFYSLILDYFENYTLYFFIFFMLGFILVSLIFFLISTFNNRSIDSGVLYIFFLIAFYEIILILLTRLRI
jgi:hypothetical protein